MIATFQSSGPHFGVAIGGQEGSSHPADYLLFFSEEAFLLWSLLLRLFFSMSVPAM